MDGLDESSPCPECGSDDWNYTDELQQHAKCDACGREWAVLDADDLSDIDDVSRRQ
ncbi:MAG: hypothetical protein AB7N61_12400 [Acidimicrobiia bacterium]